MELTLLQGYLIGINAITFLIYAIDKAKARADAWRVRESTLVTLAVIGGSLGALLAMIICRHKIRVPKFKYGIPAILLVQAGLIYFTGGIL